MKFIFTDKDQYFKDEYQEAWLSEETGWWTPKGIIYIWTKGISKLRQIGIAVHEGFEWIILCRVIYRLRKDYRKTFSLLANVAHNIANILEFVSSLGTADQYWGKRDWYGGKNQGDAGKNIQKRKQGQ